MSGSFTAFHPDCNASETKAKQCQRARLGNLGGTNRDHHIVMVIIANIAIVQADYEVIFFNIEEVEVGAGVRFGNVVELTAVGAVIVDGNTTAVDELEVQQGVKTTVEYGAELVIRVAVGIEYQRVTPVKLVVIVRFFTQIGEGQFERIGAGGFQIVAEQYGITHVVQRCIRCPGTTYASGVIVVSRNTLLSYSARCVCI